MLATVKRFPQRKWFLISCLVAAFALGLVSCSGGHSSTRSQVPITDTRPVGEGLKVIGFGLLGAAVVLVLGRMIRS